MNDLTKAEIDGARLKIARESVGLSQSQVASKIGINKQTISSYENNHGNPSADILLRLCMLYKIDARNLISN